MNAAFQRLQVPNNLLINDDFNSPFIAFLCARKHITYDEKNFTTTHRPHGDAFFYGGTGNHKQYFGFC